MINLPNRLLLRFDGACEPTNPGGWMAYGWTVHAGNELLHQDHGIICKPNPENTNNMAEYFALGYGLKWLLDQGWKGELRIEGDSNLVVKQVAKAWACKAEKLRPLRDRCHEILKLLGNNFETAWIPRESNTYCDELTRRALMEAGA